jgi:hypothetical protein
MGTSDTVWRPARLGDLDRATLAVLGREWLLHGHLQDRVGMALVLGSGAGREVMQLIAIEEWMAASPIYSRRMQQTMDFAGTGVDTIVKNLQLDIGAPHEFMDFRFRLHDAEHAEFWLAHCGALMDVEPLGEDFVRGMCHAIEDPTFDATAAATNPQAQVRPIHRPPRHPADRMPHCHWRIDIVAAAEPVQPHPLQAVVAGSNLARLPVHPPGPAESGDDGWMNYSGPVDPDFRLERLARPALVAVLDEFALQSQLLLRSFLASVEQALSPGAAGEMVPRLVTGWCGLTAQRIGAALGLEPTPHGLASMLALHPMFAPDRYIAAQIEVRGDRVRLGFANCPAGDEGDGRSWFSQLGGAGDHALEAVVRAFAPTARFERVAAGEGQRHSYDVVLEADGEPAPEPPELAIAKFSTGAAFRFGRRRLSVLP